MNNESFSKLEAIVSESKPESSNYDTLNSQLEARSGNIAIQKSNDIIDQASRIHGDNSEAVFKTWMAGTRDFNLNRETRKYYWDTYDSLSGDPKVAQESLRDNVKNKLTGFTNTFEKETYIRDNLDKWPEWLEKEYEPVLANFMIMNQSKDMLKNEFVYKESTLDKMANVLNSSDLDPDTPELDHIADFKKFATMDLLDGAMIVNGRLGITNSEKEFEPAWSISDKSKVTGMEEQDNPAISAFLRDSIEKETNSLVSVNLDKARSKIREQTNTLNMGIMYEMRQGNVPVERWGDMAALIEDPSLSPAQNLGMLFSEGVRGYIDRHPDIKYKELTEFIKLAVDKYSHLITGGNKRG